MITKSKVSEITVDDIQNYLRLSEIDDNEKKFFERIKDISIDYILNYTGLKVEEVDNYSDLVIVVYVLCQDMYDNRTYYVDKGNVNKVVQSILDMHSRNLIA